MCTFQIRTRAFFQYKNVHFSCIFQIKNLQFPKMKNALFFKNEKKIENKQRAIDSEVFKAFSIHIFTTSFKGYFICLLQGAHSWDFTFINIYFYCKNLKSTKVCIGCLLKQLRKINYLHRQYTKIYFQRVFSVSFNFLAKDFSIAVIFWVYMK